MYWIIEPNDACFKNGFFTFLFWRIDFTDQRVNPKEYLIATKA